jgi:hypothetical protein
MGGGVMAQSLEIWISGKGSILADKEGYEIWRATLHNGKRGGGKDLADIEIYHRKEKGEDDNAKIVSIDADVKSLVIQVVEKAETIFKKRKDETEQEFKRRVEKSYRWTIRQQVHFHSSRMWEFIRAG